MNMQRLVNSFSRRAKQGTGNGNPTYFTNIVKEVVDDFDGDIGDRKLLNEKIEHRLRFTVEPSGRYKTNWGYKNGVIPLIEEVYRELN